jgi:CrcB protein
MNFSRVAVIFLGAGVGGVLRYLLAAAIQGRAGGNFPHGTLWVNLAGSLAIGLFIGLHERNLLASESDLSFFLTTGLCGGFTTLSTFSAETLGLLREKMPGHALLYAGATLLGCMSATLLGLAIGFLLARLAGGRA